MIVLTACVAARYLEYTERALVKFRGSELYGTLRAWQLIRITRVGSASVLGSRGNVAPFLRSFIADLLYPRQKLQIIPGFISAKTL